MKPLRIRDTQKDFYHVKSRGKWKRRSRGSWKTMKLSGTSRASPSGSKVVVEDDVTSAPRHTNEDLLDLTKPVERSNSWQKFISEIPATDLSSESDKTSDTNVDSSVFQPVYRTPGDQPQNRPNVGEIQINDVNWKAVGGMVNKRWLRNNGDFEDRETMYASQTTDIPNCRNTADSRCVQSLIQDLNQEEIFATFKRQLMSTISHAVEDFVDDVKKSLFDVKRERSDFTATDVTQRGYRSEMKHPSQNRHPSTDSESIQTEAMSLVTRPDQGTSEKSADERMGRKGWRIQLLSSDYTGLPTPTATSSITSRPPGPVYNEYRLADIAVQPTTQLHTSRAPGTSSHTLQSTFHGHMERHGVGSTNNKHSDFQDTHNGKMLQENTDNSFQFGTATEQYMIGVGLTAQHLKKSKLMFFFTRYPCVTTLKSYFSDVQFSRSTTSQLIKWFSNFREFYYMQIERFAREAVCDGVEETTELVVDRDSELFHVLNIHYNKSNDFQVPQGFLEVTTTALREFFSIIRCNNDLENGWKKIIYKVISKLDQKVPEIFKSVDVLYRLA